MKSRRTGVALVVTILLAGCAGANVGLRAGDSSPVRNPVPTPGSSYSYAAAQAEANPNAYFGVFFLGTLLFGMHDGFRYMDGRTSGRKPPELDPRRSIAERDCTRPLGPLEGNLRCK